MVERGRVDVYLRGWRDNGKKRGERAGKKGAENGLNVADILSIFRFPSQIDRERGSKRVLVDVARFERDG